MALRVAEVLRPESSFAPNGHRPKPPKPHHEDCPRQIVMERERLKFAWGVERLGDRFEYLPHNRDFWRVWGPKHLPECTCWPIPRNAGMLVELRPHTNGNGHKNGAFKLHFQRNISAPVYSGLRARLVTWAFKTTGNIAVVDMDLDVLAPMAGRTSTQVLNTLAAFERKHHSSSGSNGSSPSHKPSRSSSSSKSS